MATITLGENQTHALRSFAEYGPYPGGGWIWSNHSTTVRLAESLVKHRLVEKTESQYRITPAGRDYLAA